MTHLDAFAEGQPHDERDPQTTVDALRKTLHRARYARGLDAFTATAALDELDAWLRDDRQWSRGQVQHWRDLIDDLVRRAREVASFARGSAQSALRKAVDDLKRARAQLGSRDRVPDEADRRKLGHVAASLRRGICDTTLPADVWRHVVDSAAKDPQRAEQAIAVLADLLTLRGHQGWDLVDRVSRVLADKNLDVTLARGHKGPVSDLNGLAGSSPSERLALVTTLIETASPEPVSVVWLEFTQATVRSPPVLHVGQSVVLINGDFLREAVHHPQNLWELPSELKEADSGLDLWLGARSEETATAARDGDPRVYVRISVPPQPPRRALATARLTATFLVAYGALRGKNTDTWILTDNHAIPGEGFSVGGYSFDEVKSRHALNNDRTAARLFEQAALLGPRLPISGGQLETAAHLAVWLRDAMATENPARLVLCERVIEQVCGWAGFGEPSRFVSAVLRPSWIYGELLREVDSLWWTLRADLGATDPPALVDVETWAAPPPHAPDEYHGPAFNLQAVLVKLDALKDVAPSGSRSARQLTLLQRRSTDKEAMKHWLDELGATFERRAGRLRRTRNALMHGGPLAPRTVDDAAVFAEALARHAISPAVDFLLAGHDLIDAFTTRAERQDQCLRSLRDGVHPKTAMFWDI